jgi:CTP-dependent riboflavin kinase
LSATTIVFRGRVASGKGVAVGFTSADWARQAFVKLVGIDPHPGTLNLIVPDGPDLDAWRRLRATPGLRMSNPDPKWCDGLLYPVSLPGGIKAAIVVPEVGDYDPRQVEIIAPVRLREALGLADNDLVEVTAAVGAS